MIATGSWDGLITLWEVNTGKIRISFQAHEGPIYAIVIFPDGVTLASGGDDKNLCIWDLKVTAEKRMVPNVVRFDAAVAALAVDSNGKYIAVGDYTGKVSVIGVREAKGVVLVYKHELCVTCVAFTSDGSHVASGSDDGVLQCWCIAVPKKGQTRKSGYGAINAIAFSQSDALLAVACGHRASGKGFVEVLQAPGLKVKSSWIAHDEAVLYVAFLQGDRFLASAARDSSVRIWRPLHGAGVWE
jgi:WD40 repeat protein